MTADRHITGFARRRALVSAVRLAAWLCVPAAIIAASISVWLGIWALVIGVAVSAIAGLVVAMRRDRVAAADALDRAMALPQTIGTYERSTGQDRVWLTPAANAAMANRRPVAVAWPRGPVLLACLVTVVAGAWSLAPTWTGTASHRTLANLTSNLVSALTPGTPDELSYIDKDRAIGSPTRADQPDQRSPDTTKSTDGRQAPFRTTPGVGDGSQTSKRAGMLDRSEAATLRRQVGDAAASQAGTVATTTDDPASSTNSASGRTAPQRTGEDLGEAVQPAELSQRSPAGVGLPPRYDALLRLYFADE